MNNGEIWKSNLDVWDASFAPDNKYLFVGARHLENNTGKINSDLSEDYGRLKNYFWERSDMCGGCPTITMMYKVLLSTFEVTPLNIFGGQEIRVSENKLIFSNYNGFEGKGLSDVYYCWVQIIPHSADCNNLDITTNELQFSDDTVIKTYNSKKVGMIHNIKDELKLINDINEIINFLNN